ncbi:MAG: hypothetical protein AAFX65_06080 [Cyanobacteria bacterium J06638_7]
MPWCSKGRRSRLRGHQPPPDQAGFLLPLSLTVALLLMLSSLMLLTLALQSRLQAAVQRQRRLTEDQLMSAAQLWAGGVQRGCPEALALAHTRWAGETWISAPGCAGLEAGEGYRVVSYGPGGGPGQGTAELVLELSGQEPPPRAAFALHWRRQLPAAAAAADGESTAAEGAEAPAGPLRLAGIEERGLRQSAAAAEPGAEADR